MSSIVLSTAIYALAGAVGGWVAARVHCGRWDLAPALLFASACGWIFEVGPRPAELHLPPGDGLASYGPSVFHAHMQRTGVEVDRGASRRSR